MRHESEFYGGNWKKWFEKIENWKLLNWPSWFVIITDSQLHVLFSFGMLDMNYQP